MSGIGETPAPAPAGAGGRVAFGTVARAVGEVVAKASSVVFYLVMAHKLGDAKFGDFAFGLSLSGVVLSFAALGSEELISRDVARDREAVHRLFFNVSMLKLATIVPLWLLVGAITAIAGYPLEVGAAIMLIGAGVGFERQARNYHAVFIAFERNEFTALSLIAARGITAAVGVVALLEGAGLLVVAAIYVLGTMSGNAIAWFSMSRWVVRPRRLITPGDWPRILKVSVPLGLVTVLYVLLLRVDATMLSFLAGGSSDNSELGQYAAAQRLMESTMFISWAAGGALLPWLARHSGEAEVTLMRGYEVGLKVVVAALLPIAAVYVVLADPLISLLYDEAEFGGAVDPLRLLGISTVLFGINTMVGVLAISRDNPRDFAIPAVGAIVQNVAFNFVLIPKYGATGAAVNAVLSGVLLAVWSTWSVGRRFEGWPSPLRVLTAPLLAAAAMSAILLWGGLAALPLIAAGVVYVSVFMGLERALFPADYHFYDRALGGRLARRGLA